MNVDMTLIRRNRADPAAPMEFCIVIEQFGQTITIPEAYIWEFAIRAVNMNATVEYSRGAMP